MSESRDRFSELYRPVGTVILLAIIIILLLQANRAPAPVAVPTPTVPAPTVGVPTVAPSPVALPTAAPPTVAPATVAPATVAPATAAPVALPKLNVPAAADFTADGAKLSGTGQPGETIELWDGATRVGVVKVGADGAWSLAGKLAEGPHKLVARTVDAAGKTLNEAPGVDVTVPKPIVLPKLNLPATADFTLAGAKLSGAGQPGATVEVWEGATKVGTATVGADGAWSLTAKVSDGARKLTVRTVDAAGKTLNESLAVDVTVPKIVAQPKINAPAPADFTADGVKLGGTGQPGETVEVWDGVNKLGTVKVRADGAWALTSKLAEGSHKMLARTVDASGGTLNWSPLVDVVVPKAVALPKLNVPAAADFSAAGAKLGGTGQPGAIIEVWDGATRVMTATVGADGAWSGVGKLAEGSHKLAVRTVDAAGKTLNEAPAMDITVPKAPTPTTDLAAAGQAYIVKPEDWLSRLAQTFYGDVKLYTLIIEGTNAKAAVDPTFAKITDPDRIEPGQKLWIPARPAGS
jgi:LysM repeat protein